MRITFLGTSHGYAEKNRFTSSTLIEVSGFYYLLDCGAPVEWLMVNLDKPFDKIRGIFITHMHNDHIGCLTSVIEPMLRYRYNDKAICLFPSEKGKESYLVWSEALQVPRERVLSTVKMYAAEQGRVYDQNGLLVTARPTKHMEDSFAYVFEADGKKVLFTGDMSAGFREYESIAGNEHYDLVVCEMAHAKLGDVQNMLKKTDTDRMLINHYYHECTENHEEIFKSFPFPVAFAEDCMETEI